VARFTLDDFMAQMGHVKTLGPLGNVLRIIPGMSELTRQMGLSGFDVERQLVRMSAIYGSMTDAERVDTGLLNTGRRRRIADGAGVPADEVSRFIRQFEMSRDMMQKSRFW